MANTIISPNMNLVIPVAGVDPGPDWALNLNASLSTIDSHNHTPGFGVAIPPQGLNINADLTFQGNNATNLRSTRYAPQNAVLSTPTDIGCLYVVTADLFYNDVSGNNIRITQNGALAGTPGSIANLSPPASASYVSGSGTFVFQSNVNTAANIDVESIVLRNSTALSKGLTLSPPAAMAANINIVFPTIPSVQSIMEMDTAGNITTVPVTSIYVPTATVLTYSGPSVPSGFIGLTGVGQTVSRTTYSTLFGVIGTTYGAGDGSTTFGLPEPQNPFNFLGASSIPSFVQSYWKMSQLSGGEPNFATPGGVFDLVQNGTVSSAAGHIAGLTSRGPYTNSTNYFNVPAGGSGTTVYDSKVFAVGFWMKSNSPGAQEPMLGKRDHSNNGWDVATNASNFVIANLGSTTISATSINVMDNSWHLVFLAQLAISGSGNLRIYVDNTLVGSASGVNFSTSITDFTVGAAIDTGTDAFPGLLQAVEYWDSMPGDWTTFESLINNRWNGGAGIDYTAVIPATYMIKT